MPESAAYKIVIYEVLADLVVVVHLAFVLFAAFGGLLVMRWRRMAWIQVPAFIWGALIEFAGWICPLTPLEIEFRLRAGYPGYGTGFVERYLIPVLYPANLTRTVQIALGAFVLAVNGFLYARLWKSSKSGKIGVRHHLFEEKTILVTGSTDGIGRQTALELAVMGHRLLIHGRDPAKGEAVLEEMRKAAGHDRLELFTADLSSLRETRGLAAAVRAKHDRLHVLINNAGTYMPERMLTEDGLETTFVVNFLAPFLLTELLLDLLKRSAPSRIVTVSSIAHESASFEPDNLQGEREYDAYQAYALSKLAALSFTLELAGRLKGSGVTANCLHPGVIGTKLLHAAFPIAGASVREGAETPVYLAVSPEVEGVTGGYFIGKRPSRPSRLSRDAATRKIFWEIAERLTGAAEGER